MDTKTVRELARIFATLKRKDLKAFSDIGFKEAENHNEVAFVSALLDAATFAENFGKDAPKIMKSAGDAIIRDVKARGLLKQKS
jgi:hypothetical protein